MCIKTTNNWKKNEVLIDYDSWNNKQQFKFLKTKGE